MDKAHISPRSQSYPNIDGGVNTHLVQNIRDWSAMVFSDMVADPRGQFLDNVALHTVLFTAYQERAGPSIIHPSSLAGSWVGGGVLEPIPAASRWDREHSWTSRQLIAE